MWKPGKSSQVFLVTVALTVIAVVTIGSLFDSPPFTANNICTRSFLVWSSDAGNTFAAQKPANVLSPTSDPQSQPTDSPSDPNGNTSLGTISNSVQDPELHVQSSQEQTSSPPANSEHYTYKGLDPAPNITLEDAFFKYAKVLNVSQVKTQLTGSAAQNFKSRFLPNQNYLALPVLAVENVCIHPSGALMLVGTSLEEITPNISGRGSIPELWYTFHEIYNCTGNVSTDHCIGVMTVDNLPEKHSWFPGNTVHLHPYLGNAMHNLGERVWPFIAAASAPYNGTTAQPWHHFLIHRFDKLLRESAFNFDRKTVLWQFRMLMELADPSVDYLLVGDQTEPACFERFLLQMHDRDRIDQTRVPLDIAAPAMRKYRSAVFKFFGLPESQVRSPPAPLRVSYYGRSDAPRRRIVNNEEVIDYLKNFSGPPFEVNSIDDMLKDKTTSYDLPQMLQLFSQTDILIIAHGASTWTTFLVPEMGCVVEIFGPCNWSISNYSDISVMKTWIRVLTGSAKLKHDISNPFGVAIPDPRRGNTTKCLHPFDGVPHYTVDTEKLGKIIHSFAYPDRPNDPITMHWLYDWEAYNKL